MLFFTVLLFVCVLCVVVLMLLVFVDFRHFDNMVCIGLTNSKLIVYHFETSEGEKEREREIFKYGRELIC